MKLKTKKSIAKRFKITKTGKILHRKSGQDHFNARESGKVTRGKRPSQEISQVNKKRVKRAIPYH